ncbi:hypothetical protein NCG89_04960 [Spongiibacter taiwanensis]|uniref:hypothetical protein n=1 Tax=Spongiibacter taiwanensis TaxID=1748242 RepID=UPI002035A3C0|nr:hypothetical protein [Spongiibacter taiwanensis]USA44134.1 hypothetical protein NCG89_04960 [Spongiibacter taiwanensis]
MADRICEQAPAKVIGTHYLTRWYVIPRNRLFNVYLHHVEGNDPDENLHDHPWLFNGSLVLRGEIFEQLRSRSRTLQTGSLTFRMGRSPHRLLLRSNDSLTLFITGPKVRRWGFYTDAGWVDSKQYLRADGDGRTVRTDFETVE